MKTKEIPFIFLLAVLCINVFAQAPQVFKYQTVIRNTSGEPVSNQLVAFQFSLLQGSAMGPIVYSETNSTSTNQSGLAALEIGNGEIVSGDFGSIDWGADIYFLQVEVDVNGGSSYQLMGTSQLLSVPYSLYAEKAGSVEGGMVSEIDDLTDGKTGGSSVFLGEGSGLNDDASNNQNVGTGNWALHDNITGSQNTALGVESMYHNTSGYQNVAVGTSSLYSNETGYNNVGVGHYALKDNTAWYNTVVGKSALRYNTNGARNTIVGAMSGYSNTAGSYNVFLGNESGYFETGSAKLYIENSNADQYNALIYGEFDNDLLRVNGTLDINNAYQFPTVDGTSGQVLGTDGSGSLSWTNSESAGSMISDIDGNTYVTVEGTPNDDIIRFYNNGIEHFRFNGLNLELFTGTNLYIGEAAGINETNIMSGWNSGIGRYTMNNNSTGRYNTALGYSALNQNISSDNNVAIGSSALYWNTSFKNTAVGSNSSVNNTTGYSNTSIGYTTMKYNTTGSNNSALGSGALIRNTTGVNNVGIGVSTNSHNIEGSNNTIIGASAGGYIYDHSKSGNVFLGYKAGYNEIGDNKLYIENSNADKENALIYGEFDNDILAVNGKLGIGSTTPETALHVADSGDIRLSGGQIDFGDQNRIINYSSNDVMSVQSPGPVAVVIDNNNNSTNTAAFTVKKDNIDPELATELFRVQEDGNVGIGTTEPSEKLHVDGGFKLVNGTEGSGKILTSDGSGTASWEKVTDVTSGLLNPSFPNGLEGIVPITVEVTDNTPFNVPPKVTLYIVNVYSSWNIKLLINNLPVTYGPFNYSDGTTIAQRLSMPLLVGTGGAVSTDGLPITINGYLVGNGTGGSATTWTCGDMLVDERDGQAYTTVLIGTQCWMAKNLNLGTMIPVANDQADNGIIEKYCYDDDAGNCSTYGGLYQWDEMMQYINTEGTQGICPDGWHIPTDAEYTSLTDFLGGLSVAGGKMKETGTTHWNSPNTGATNESGFTGLSGGWGDDDGTFISIGYYGIWWSSTEDYTLSWARILSSINGTVFVFKDNEQRSYSVRCLRD